MTRRRDEHQRSRAVLDDSRVLLHSAHETLAQARRSMSRQKVLRVVCAWCTRTICWQHAPEAVLSHPSHGMCSACAADFLREIERRRHA
jgi:hypothetical protein